MRPLVPARIVQMSRIIVFALAAFFIAPGGAALAETIADAVCANESGGSTLVFASFYDGDITQSFNTIIISGSINGQIFYGYCLDAGLHGPSSCTDPGGAEIITANGPAGCVAATLPPGPPSSYQAIINNTAGAIATWHFTNDIDLLPLAQAMDDPDWSGGRNVTQIWANLLGGFPEYDGPEQVYTDIISVYDSLVASCAGAEPVALPALTSLGDAAGTLPGDQTLDLVFHTDAGAGVSVAVSVSGATLVSSPSPTTDDDGNVTVTVHYSGSSSGTVTVDGQIPAPIGSAINLNMEGVQDVSVNDAHLFYYESSASADFSWDGEDNTPSPTMTPTSPATELPNTGSGSTSDRSWVLVAAATAVMILGGLGLRLRRR